jgi:hypothetical protein
MRRHVAWLAILVAFVSTGSVRAHHSLANDDTTRAVRVKGTFASVKRACGIEGPGGSISSQSVC